MDLVPSWIPRRHKGVRLGFSLPLKMLFSSETLVIEQIALIIKLLINPF